jgi:purine-binding chemotaxis protein CheW
VDRDALQQVLAQLNSGRAASSYTPEQLADLARRAGVSDPAQIALLERAMGVGPSPSTGNSVPQHLLFQVAETECALPAEVVQGIERISDVTSVPNTVSWVLGIVQVWGAIVSVVDLQAFFGFAPQSLTPRSRLVVVTRGEMSVGFLVSGVTEMRALGDDLAARLDPQGVPEWARPYAQGLLALDGRVVVLLDAGRLLASDKLHRYQGG